MEETGLDENSIQVDDSCWSQIIRPLGFDAGIRSLSRTLQSICRKSARKVVDGRVGPFKITAENLAEYLGV